MPKTDLLVVGVGGDDVGCGAVAGGDIGGEAAGGDQLGDSYLKSEGLHIIILHYFQKNASL